MKILDFLKENIVLLDGATGSLLQKRGMPAGMRPERVNITDAQMLIQIHKEYYDAGSNIVNTNTFGANTLSFTGDELEKIISAAIMNVRTAARLSGAPQEKFVSYDMGPTGKLLKPYGDLEFEKAVEIFALQARLAEKYGADLISIETMNDGYETKAALLAVKENCSLPVFVTNAYGEDGRLLTGASPEAMVAMLEGMGADAIGLNCSYGPDRLLEVIRKILGAASVPVIFKPNAGLPSVTDGKTVYDISPDVFTTYMMKAVDEGVNIIGGCCGTTPENIAKLKAGIKDKKRIPETEKNLTVVSSYSHEIVFADRPLIIGERINPTGKKLIKQALTENNIDYLLKEGREQQNKGADILDVNCGLPEIDEKTMLTRTVSELQAVCDLPLQIDTSDYLAMESALRIYNGKPVINSVNGKTEVMKSVFPLAAKYGGVIVALTLDEEGIPPDAGGRLRIAEKIIGEAKKYGIEKKNLIFDPLTLTVSADSSAAMTTLEAVRLITEKTGCKTVLGVSNVSFGLPQRSRINSVFFSLAMQSGLSAAIINPMSDDMMASYYSFLALTGKDKSCLGYIKNMNAEAAPAAVPVQADAGGDSLRKCIVEGRRDAARDFTKKLLEIAEPLSIINDEIIPALDEVGKNFESKKSFLPELLLSAEAAKEGFEEIKRRFSSGSGGKKLTVILATVHGDIHDIGKNIVKLLLENYGYSVIDLGKDVPPESILESARENGAALVGLSALMTTTVPAMEETIRLIKANIPGCRVMVGGAVLTKEYAESINADAYCADAMETVRYAEKIYTEINTEINTER